MSSASLLQLLATQARLSDGELAERLDMTEEAVRAQREQWEKEGVILGYQAVVNEEYEHDSKVAAFIEVKMTPERDGGFDRLAMRISNVSPDAERYAEEAVAHPYGVIESNADNASLDVSQTNDQNPLRWLVEDYSDVHAAAEIVTYMKSFDDPRLSKYFNPAVRDSEYHGSRVGAYSSSQWKDYYSLPKTNALDRLMWMNAAEVAFLKAEMAVNGWDVTGDAKTLYEEGIRLSFEQYQAENYTSYIAGTAAPTAYSDPRRANNYTPGTAYSVTVAWDGALSAEKQREKIITQKWIALYPLGTEAWAEQRRTGYPRFYPTPTSTNASNEPNLPTEGASRIPFAPNEQTRNADNYDAAVALLGAGGDKFGTRLWWDVKTDKPAW